MCTVACTATLYFCPNPDMRLRQQPISETAIQRPYTASAHGLSGASLMGLGRCLRPMLAKDGSAATLRSRIALPRVEGRFAGFPIVDIRNFIFPESVAERSAGKTKISGFSAGVAKPDHRGRSGDCSGQLGDADHAVSQGKLVALGGGRRCAGSSGHRLDPIGLQRDHLAVRDAAARLDVEQRLAHDLGERIARTILARSGQLVA